MADQDFTVLYMWNGHRQRLIEENEFYLEQAKKRILSQFEESEMEAEARRFADETYEIWGQHFDPDRHDPGENAEDAYHAGIDFYGQLSDMRETVRLSVISSMFHNWEKELRDWLTNEIRKLKRSDNLERCIWTVTLDKIFDLLTAFSFDLRSQSYYTQLDACGLIVNVFKHGDGRSLDALKERHPQYFDHPLKEISPKELSDLSSLNYKHLRVEDKVLSELSSAIQAFWLDVPEYTMASKITQLPHWFERALNN